MHFVCIAIASVLGICGCVAVFLIVKSRRRRKRRDVELARLKANAHNIVQPLGMRNRLTKRPPFHGTSICGSTYTWPFGSETGLLAEQDMNLMVRCASDLSLFPGADLIVPTHPHPRWRPVILPHNRKSSVRQNVRRLPSIVESPLSQAHTQDHPAFRTRPGCNPGPDHGLHRQTPSHVQSQTKPRLYHDRSNALVPTDTDMEETTGGDKQGSTPLRGQTNVQKSPHIATSEGNHKVVSSYCVLENATSESTEQSQSQLDLGILNSHLSEKPEPNSPSVQANDITHEQIVGLMRRVPSRDKLPLVSETGSPPERRRPLLSHHQTRKAHVVIVQEPSQTDEIGVLDESNQDDQVNSLAGGQEWPRDWPQEWPLDCVPKPSNLKGSPNARKGHKRQATVRIVSKPTGVHLARSRESTISNLQDGDASAKQLSRTGPWDTSIPEAGPAPLISPPSAQQFSPKVHLPLFYFRRRSPRSSSRSSSQRSSRSASAASISASNFFSLTTWPEHNGTPIGLQVSLQRPSSLLRQNSSSPTLPSVTMSPDSRRGWMSRSDAATEVNDTSEVSLQFPQLDFGQRHKRAHTDDELHDQQSSKRRSTRLSVTQSYCGQRDAASPSRNPTLNKPIMPPAHAIPCGPRDAPPAAVLKTIQSLRRQDSGARNSDTSREEQRYRNLGRPPSLSSPEVTSQPDFSFRKTMLIDGETDKENLSVAGSGFWDCTAPTTTPHWRRQSKFGGHEKQSPFSLYDDEGFLKSTFPG